MTWCSSRPCAVSTERRRDGHTERRDLPASAPRARIQTLGLLHRACWDELDRATREREHGWRTVALATVAADGCADARSVILREVDAAASCLRIYTDARSLKVAQIRAQPLGSLLAWCPRLSWQLRLRVRLRVDTGEPAVRPRWARLRLTPGAQDYISALSPGSPLGDGAMAADMAASHFALVHADVLAMDWLELHADGHRRALFDTDGERWVQP